MKCEELAMLLSAYVDGEVSNEERQTVVHHLQMCELCRTTVVEFSRLHRLYQEMEIQEAPPGFRQRVTQRLESMPRVVFTWRIPRLVYAISLAGLLLFGGIMIVGHFTRQPFHQDLEPVVDVYAEDILFDQAVFSIDELFSVGEMSIAEEILYMIDLPETGTSWSFDRDRRSLLSRLNILERAQPVGFFG